MRSDWDGTDKVHIEEFDRSIQRNRSRATTLRPLYAAWSGVLDDSIANGALGAVEAASDPLRFAAALVHGLRAHKPPARGAEASHIACAGRLVVPATTSGTAKLPELDSALLCQKSIGPCGRIGRRCSCSTDIYLVHVHSPARPCTVYE